MTRTGAIVGNVYIDGRWTPGRVAWNDGVVSEIEPLGKYSEGLFFVPGFIDLHCHGGGGADAMEGEKRPIRLRGPMPFMAPQVF